MPTLGVAERVIACAQLHYWSSALSCWNIVRSIYFGIASGSAELYGVFKICVGTLTEQ